MSTSAPSSPPGGSSPPPEFSVFLNCPYDSDFRERFDALVFAVVCCGLEPRSAIERRDVATSRIDRILHATFTSLYSIHDLSRCRGEGDANLARFNMPLELGMAMAKRRADEAAGLPEEDRHSWLALVPAGPNYRQYVSDLSGYDLETYDESAAEVVAATMAWLVGRRPETTLLTPKRVVAGLPAFQNAVAGLRDEWNGREPWRGLVGCARRVSESLVSAGA